jgi:drug/metabolite transporter (DMT)-like permease
MGRPVSQAVPRRAPSEALKGHAAMLAFSALVAGSFALGAMATPHIEPIVLNGVRFVIASCILGVAALSLTGIPRSAMRAPWRYFILGGLMGLYFVLMFEALKTAPPVSAAAVFTLTPVFSGLFGYILLRQVTTPRMAFALAVGAVGALWVIFRADWEAFLAFEVGKGELIFLVGCTFHALYTPMVRLLNRGERPLVFSLGAMIAAACLLCSFGWTEIMATEWSALPPIVWVTLGYTAFFATAMSFVLLQFATLHLPSAKVMAYTYLTPTWVLVWQAALGHGLPAGPVVVGVGLTAVALLLLLKNEDAPA